MHTRAKGYSSVSSLISGAATVGQAVAGRKHLTFKNAKPAGGTDDDAPGGENVRDACPVLRLSVRGKILPF